MTFYTPTFFTEIELSELLLIYIVVCLGAGVCVGLIGIGGVFIVPTLLLLDVPVKTAIASSLCAFSFGAVVASYTHFQMGHVPFEPLKWLSVPAVIFTGVGSALVSIAPKAILILIVGCIAIISSIQLGYQTYQLSLASDGKDSKNDMESDFEENNPPHHGPLEIEQSVDNIMNWSRVRLMVIGAITGFLSPLTGTGGPFIMWPAVIFILPQIPPNQVVGLALTLSVFICACATITFFFVATIDLGISLVGFVFMSIGLIIGAKLHVYVNEFIMKCIITFVLFALGTYILIKNI